MRSHRNLWSGADGTIQRFAQRKGFGFRFTVQYLRTLWTAPRPHWEPGRGILARGSAPRGNELFVFCGQYPGRTLFQLHAGGAQSECIEIPAVVDGASGGSTATSAQAETATREEETNEADGNEE